MNSNKNFSGKIDVVEVENLFECDGEIVCWKFVLCELTRSHIIYLIFFLIIVLINKVFAVRKLGWQAYFIFIFFFIVFIAILQLFFKLLFPLINLLHLFILFKDPGEHYSSIYYKVS